MIAKRIVVGVIAAASFGSFLVGTGHLTEVVNIVHAVFPTPPQPLTALKNL